MQLMPYTYSDAALAAAASTDREAVLALMKEQLKHRLADGVGDTIEEKLELQAFTLEL